MNPPRKPAQPAITLQASASKLMEQLGVSSWTEVPNAVLERWMAPDQPARLRLMAAVVRYSFGYRSAYAVHLVKGQQRPLRQADLSRLLSLHEVTVRRLLVEIRREGLVMTDGNRVYPIPNPPPASSTEHPGRKGERSVAELAPSTVSSPLAVSSPVLEEALDSEYYAEAAEIKADYRREISAAKARMWQRLQIARSKAKQRAAQARFVADSATLPEQYAVADSATETVADSATVQGPYKRNENETKGPPGRQAAQVETEAGPPAFPSLEVEELHRYLESLVHLVGTAPHPAETAEIHKRLKSASIEQYRTHVSNRLARGLQPRGWRIFRELADDCGQARADAGQAGQPEASAPPERQAKIARLQRALGVKP